MSTVRTDAFGSTLDGQVRGLVREVRAATAGTVFAADVERLAARLDEPLRIAVAGRLKAGKSTLLNALVGERLAATDAGECTRIVTWFREGQGYEVAAVAPDGTRHELAFSRDGGRLVLDLSTRDPATVDRLDVRWPSPVLARLTLIDTPGLASTDDEVSQRTMAALSPDGRPGDADVVVYLMRHLHRRDADFLAGFADRSFSEASPVTAVAVLSRADEIGGGRPDAMTSAARIAARYASDDVVRARCLTVVPVAGLLAETGQTITEAELATLRTLASTDVPLDDLVLSAERIVKREVVGTTEVERRTVVERLGVYGVRLAVGAIRDGSVTTASELSARLLAASGLDALRRVILRDFLPRARLIKAGTVLQGLQDLVPRLAEAAPSQAEQLAGAVEAVVAGAHELDELRLLHDLRTGAVAFSEIEAAEVERLTAPAAAPDVRLGVDGAGRDAQLDAARAGIERWRSRGSGPLVGTEVRAACDVVVRSYEAIHRALSG